MAKSDQDEREEPRSTTTINVSKAFGEMVTELAKHADETVREFCDRRWGAEVRSEVKKVLRKRLETIDIGGES